MKQVTFTETQNKIQKFYEKQLAEAKDYLLSVYNKEEYQQINFTKKYWNENYGCYDSKQYFYDLVQDEEKSFAFIKKYKDNLTAMAYYYYFSLEYKITDLNTAYSNHGTFINMIFLNK